MTMSYNDLLCLGTMLYFVQHQSQGTISWDWLWFACGSMEVSNYFALKNYFQTNPQFQ